MSRTARELGSWASVELRTLQPERTERETFLEYMALADGRSLCPGPELIGEVEASGLRGRGGAGFPAGLKLRAVAERPGPRSLVANGEEGEPASVKDRWLLRMRPHLVLDGAMRAAEAIDASRIFVYVSDPLAASSVRVALEEAAEPQIPIEIVRVPRGYVAGEETAAVRYIMGGPPKPLDKPPRPFESGVHGGPTLVSNVETLANIPFIASRGATAFRAAGTAGSPGTLLLSISGAVERPGLYEVGFGGPVAEVVETLAGHLGGPVGYLMGGFFAGLLPPHLARVQLDHDELRIAGSGVGCGAIIVLGQEDCPVAAAADVMSFFARENAHQCGACFRGTAAMRDVLFDLARGTADDQQLSQLIRWTTSLKGRGACATLDGAAQLAGTLVRHFSAEVETHRISECERCAAGVVTDPTAETRFAVPLTAGQGEEHESERGEREVRGSRDL